MSEHEMERRARQTLSALASEVHVDEGGLEHLVVARGRQRVRRYRTVAVTAGVAVVGMVGALAANQLGDDAPLSPLATATATPVVTVPSTPSDTAPSVSPSLPTWSGTSGPVEPGNVLGPQPDQLGQLPLGPAFQQEWLAVLGADGVELHHRGKQVGPDCIGMSLQDSGPTGALVNCTPTGDAIHTVWVRPDGSWKVLEADTISGAYMSPDGTRAAYLSWESETLSLVQSDPSGREVARHVIPNRTGNIELRGWSEAGVWYVDETGMGVIDSRGRSTLIAPDTVGMPLPGATPELVGVQKQGDGTSCLVHVGGGQEPGALRCVGQGRMAYVDVSPSGRYVRFQDDPEHGTEGSSEGWLLDLRSGETYAVPLFGSGGQPRLTGSVTAWEDDDTLVINRAPYDREGPGGDWVRIDLRTGRAERMPPSDTVDLAIQRWG